MYSDNVINSVAIRQNIFFIWIEMPIWFCLWKWDGVPLIFGIFTCNVGYFSFVHFRMPWFEIFAVYIQNVFNFLMWNVWLPRPIHILTALFIVVLLISQAICFNSKRLFSLNIFKIYPTVPSPCPSLFIYWKVTVWRILRISC